MALDFDLTAETITTSTGNVTFTGTGAVQVPSGTTAQRPGSPATGMLRFNSTLTAIEGYDGTSWLALDQQGTVTSVNLTAPAAGITVSGGPITTSGSITLTLANDLGAIEALNTNAILCRTATDTWAARTLTAPAAGFTITNPAGTAGNPTFVLANDLNAVEGLAANGMAARTATDTWTVRTVTGTASRITLTNGDGVAGNPTIDISSAYVGQATITTLGTITTGTWTGTTIAIANGGTGQTTATAAYNALDPLTTKGDVVVHDGTNSIRIAVGSNDKVLTADSAQTSGVKWAFPQRGAGAFNQLFDDFITGQIVTPMSDLGWTVSNSGTGAAIIALGVVAADNTIGVVQLSTGTDTTGRSGFGLDILSHLFGYATFSQEWRINIPTLSVVGDEFISYFGFGDTFNVAGDIVDGAYFQYDRLTSVNWRICTSSNSTRTKTSTTTAVAAATWVKLRIDVNAAGTSIDFFINGTNVGTITTNIPTGAGRQFGINTKIEKSAGTTARAHNIDYFSQLTTFTTAR